MSVHATRLPVELDVVVLAVRLLSGSALSGA
jgi:hypothetical protein